MQNIRRYHSAIYSRESHVFYVIMNSIQRLDRGMHGLSWNQSICFKLFNSHWMHTFLNSVSIQYTNSLMYSSSEGILDKLLPLQRLCCSSTWSVPISGAKCSSQDSATIPVSFRFHWWTWRSCNKARENNNHWCFYFYHYSVIRSCAAYY